MSCGVNVSICYDRKVLVDNFDHWVGISDGYVSVGCEVVISGVGVAAGCVSVGCEVVKIVLQSIL